MDQDQLRFQKNRLLSSLFGFSQADVILKNYKLNDDEQRLYSKKCAELDSGIPFDYVVGELLTPNGYRFLLDQNVLIPRPETEELIKIVADKGDQELIVDVGTGSGFVGIQLAKYAKNILLIDVSLKALKVCRHNITLNKITNTQLFQSHLLDNTRLKSQIAQAKSWILVANLPYVPNHEKSYKRENNTAFEPDLAIYSGIDGLDLFRELLEQLTTLHLPNQCFFELDDRNIHEAKVLLGKMYERTEVVKDQNDLDRFLIGKNH
jgi:release factor glutamine methyltransferase